MIKIKITEEMYQWRHSSTRRLGFPMETQVQFPLVSYWGGYWAMMVTNPSRGVRS
ncbi:hypothetical protein Hanom_Chr07g00594531 [Helianthus anomalus]